MSDYKATLNLPHTDFAMRAGLPVREPETLKKWQQDALYEQIRQKRKGQNTFVLHDGPPYANGNLHCGHALNKILKDMIIKSKSMSQYDAHFVPGWDCHGLPIELNVEKKMGRAGDKVTATEFRKACAKYAKEQMAIQSAEFQRLGVFGDWQKPYATMDYAYEASVVRALGRVLSQGHLQQGFKPVHWCVACGSALAEAELEYEDKTSPAIDVAFKCLDLSLLKDHGLDCSAISAVIIPIWTTTPWTLPANEAVALHPEHAYVLIKSNDIVYVLAQELAEAFIARANIENHEIVLTLAGKIFEGQQLSHPFWEKSVPVILGEHVTLDAGTGAVHTAPSHGTEDYVVGLQYGLPIENLLKSNACFLDHLQHIGGVNVWKANPIVIDLLKSRGKLICETTIEHSYPHCWRHKLPLIFMATPQWFMMMDANGLRQKLLDAIDTVNWLPDWGKNRMRLMIENRPDWCLSRQRSWGTPMTLFVHKDTKALHPKSIELIEAVAKRIEKDGLEAWFNLDIVEALGDDAQDYEKVTDTLDVWFDSGVSHFAVLEQAHYGLSFPADVYLEGSDQYRGWFNSSLTTAVAMGLEAPYKNVLIHGFTVDGEGKKLSKSKGNYVELETLIAQNGADILRLWVSSTDYRYEVSISPEILQRTGDSYRRIRNTARFLLSNLFDYDHASHAVSPSNMLALDSYIVSKTQAYQDEIIKAYGEFQFHLVYQKINHFCAIDLGGFYLDIIKDRQYTLPKNSLARRSCQTAMYHMLQALTRWLAPILSFTADEIWQYIPDQTESSVFLSTWYESWPSIKGSDFEYFDKLQLLRDDVNKALELQRQHGKIGSGLEANVVLYVNEDLKSWLEPMASELKFFFITSACELKDMSTLTDNTLTRTAEHFNVQIDVLSTGHQKCERCWHRHESVGQSSAHPGLCMRCENNISGHDEQRAFV